MTYLSVGQVAQRLAERYGERRLKPADITQLFYGGRLPGDDCPIVSGRRLVPEDHLDAIAVELRRAGKLPRLAVRKAGAK